MLTIGPVSQVRAQLFYPATIPHKAAAINPGILNTGNDVVTFTNPTAGNQTMKSIVYDGINPAMFYEYSVNSNTFSGIVSFQYTDVRDPDVALIARNVAGITHLYAVAAYTRAAGGAYLEISRFDFVSNTFNFFQLRRISTSGTTRVRSAINVDSDTQDRFAVTWDELSAAGNVYVYAGVLNNTGLTFSFSPAPVALPVPTYCGGVPPVFVPLQPLSQPDISVFAVQNSPSVTNCIINVCLLDAQGSLHIFTDRFPSILGGSTTGGYYNCIQPQNGDVYNKPRIASQRYNPNASFGSAQTGLSVVYEINNAANSTSHIGSANSLIILSGALYLPGVLTTRVLTDGTYNIKPMAGPGAATPLNNIGKPSSLNTGPVVAYNRKSGGFLQNDPVLLVAWNHYDGNANLALPICIKQVANGGNAINMLTLSGSDDYAEIPRSPTGQEGIISVSGEEVNNMLFSWYDNLNAEVNFKSCAYSGSLRMSPPDVLAPLAEVRGSVLHIFAGQESSPAATATLQVYAASGGLVHRGTCSVPSTLDLNRLVQQEGMYFLMLQLNHQQITIKWIR